MRPQNGKRGLKLIPRGLYRFLRIWLILLREPYQKEILWDIRWGFRREYYKRRNLDKSSQRHSIDYWFQRETISACANTLWMRGRNLVFLIMTLMKFVN